jgi:DNA polymerase
VIVALGATALKSVLQSSGAKLQASIGHAIEHDGRLVVATYHPSFVLRAPDPESREKAYRAIVEALREAHKLIA